MSPLSRPESIHPLADLPCRAGKSIYIGPKRILFFGASALTALKMSAVSVNQNDLS